MTFFIIPAGGVRDSRSALLPFLISIVGAAPAFIKVAVDKTRSISKRSTVAEHSSTLQKFFVRKKPFSISIMLLADLP